MLTRFGALPFGPEAPTTTATGASSYAAAGTAVTTAAPSASSPVLTS